jgi:O-antigen/teichoic acid export membrane protein
MTGRAYVHFLRGPSVYFLGSGLNQIFPLLLLPILTRYLDPAAYGVAALFMGAVQMSSLVVGFGGHAAVARAYHEFPRATIHRYVGSLFVMLAATLVVALVPALIWRDALGGALGLPAGLIAVVPVTASATFVSLTNLALWQAEQRPVPYVAYATARAAAYFVGALILVVGAGLSWQGMVGAQIGTALVFAGVSVAILVRRGYLGRAWGRAEARHILRFAGPLIPHQIARFGQNWADRFFLVGLLGLEAAGLYAVAASLARVMDMAVDSYAKAWTPHVYAAMKRGGETARIRLVRQSYLYMAMIAALALLSWLVIPPLAPILLGPGFQAAVGYVPPLLLAGLLDGWFRAFAVYTLNAKRTELTSAATMAGAMVQVALLVPLIGRFGVAGAAWAMVVGAAVTLAVGVWACRRVQPMPWFAALKRTRTSG